MKDGKAAGSPGNRRAGVMDSGCGSKLAGLAHEPEAEGDVDILVIAEIALVEATYLQEQLAGIERRRAAWRKTLSRWGAADTGWPKPPRHAKP